MAVAGLSWSSATSRFGLILTGSDTIMATPVSNRRSAATRCRDSGGEDVPGDAGRHPRNLGAHTDNHQLEDICHKLDNGLEERQKDRDGDVAGDRNHPTKQSLDIDLGSDPLLHRFDGGRS
jgi:hypothetical protein